MLQQVVSIIEPEIPARAYISCAGPSRLLLWCLEETYRGGAVGSKAKRARMLKTAAVGLVGALVAIAVLTPNPWQSSREDG